MQTHLNYLDQAQRRKFTLMASTLAEFDAWKSAFRAELRSALGLAGHGAASLEAEKLACADRDLYVEEKWRLDTGEGVWTPVYLLIPKQAPPYRPVLVFHGHDPSVQYCLGNYPDPATARANLAADNNYAQALAQAGYLVVVVVQRGLDERLTSQVTSSQRSCRHLAFAYLLHGRTLLGERIWDGLCAASFVLARPDVTGSLGCTGHSAGGATALWLAALDERIGVSVISGYFSSFQGSILGREHCECNYVPYMLALGEMGDLAALVAPRPFCAIQGQSDDLFPVEGAVSQFETVMRAYWLHQAACACQLSIHPGGHAYHHASARAWFDHWMA